MVGIVGTLLCPLRRLCMLPSNVMDRLQGAQPHLIWIWHQSSPPSVSWIGRGVRGGLVRILLYPLRLAPMGPWHVMSRVPWAQTETDGVSFILKASDTRQHSLNDDCIVDVKLWPEGKLYLGVKHWRGISKSTPTITTESYKRKCEGVSMHLACDLRICDSNNQYCPKCSKPGERQDCPAIVYLKYNLHGFRGNRR